jgi:hypothetical protein
MITLSEISRRVAEIVEGKLSLYDFERWFRERSRGFHAWSDEKAKSLVFAIEEVLGDFHFDGLAEDKVAQELTATISIFEAQQGTQPQYLRQANIGANDSDDYVSMYLPASGNNNIGFNVVSSIAA